MTRTLFGAAMALATLAGPATAQTQVRAEEVTCRSQGDRGERYCEEREYTMPVLEALEVDGGANGGIRVTGWDRTEIRVLARIQAQSETGDPRALAKEVEITLGDRIYAGGPRRSRGDRSHWSVSYEVMVPRETSLTLRANNGGIALETVSGEVDARTTNGGITVVGAGGRIRGETTNGGLRIDLTGDTWRGEGLDLRSTNGGVTIRVPEGYSADLETGTVNGGIDLDFPITVQGRMHRTIRTELGEGGPLIRAMTTNGGVTLRRL